MVAAGLPARGDERTPGVFLQRHQSVPARHYHLCLRVCFGGGVFAGFRQRAAVGRVTRQILVFFHPSCRGGPYLLSLLSPVSAAPPPHAPPLFLHHPYF